jgi:hypothetical protein
MSDGRGTQHHLMSTSTVPLSIEVACDRCDDKHRTVYLEMAPAVGSTDPSYLCVPCYLDHWFDRPTPSGRVVEVTREVALAPPRSGNHQRL